MSIMQLHISEYHVPASLLPRWQMLLRTQVQGDDRTWVLTETLIAPQYGLPFIAIISPSIAILLQCIKEEPQGIYQVQYSTDPLYIHGVLGSLKAERFSAQAQIPLNDILRSLQDLSSRTSTTDYPTGDHVLLQLLEGLLQEVSTQQPADSAPVAPAKNTLERNVRNVPPRGQDLDWLFYTIIGQIQEGAALPVILQTALERVQTLLRVDRLLLYQYTVPPSLDVDQQTLLVTGEISHEICLDETIPSLLARQTSYQWPGDREIFQQYLQGLPIVTQKVTAAPHLLDGPRDVLYSEGVRAQLIVPIVISGQLKGVCVAHQIHQRRRWQSTEITLLQKLAAYLSIAIQQAELHKQLQAQQRSLTDNVQKRTQELQELLQAAQSSSQTKSHFLATMSHELRTPLTCVIGMSATLLRWSLGPLTDKQRSYLQTIHDSGEHLLELINDILDFSQVAAGKATLSVSEFSLSSLAQQCLQLFRDKAISREIALKANLKIPPGRDRFVADPRRVKQIIVNLLSNAIKFTPSGGRVILRVWLEPNTAVFQVEDTGIGIPAQQIPLLFQTFQQLDTSYQRNYDGTGLGLALTKQFVDMHHGWIEVKSVEKHGSIFTVELPEQTWLMAKKGQGQTIYGKDNSNTRLILIEDQEESATLICEMLTAAGFHVVWLVDAATAMEQSRFLQPVAVIISTDLKTGDGQNLTRQFRQSIETRHLKLIALTSSLTAKAQQKLLAHGADAYLTKPLDPEHLVHKIETLLSSTAPPAWP
jgi:two-component system, sensor histidine kinase and response regulator